MCTWILKKAEHLVWITQMSIGRTEVSKAAIESLGHLMADDELESRHKEETEIQMQELLMQVPNSSRLIRIKGIGW